MPMTCFRLTRNFQSRTAAKWTVVLLLGLVGVHLEARKQPEDPFLVRAREEQLLGYYFLVASYGSGAWDYFAGDAAAFAYKCRTTGKKVGRKGRTRKQWLATEREVYWKEGRPWLRIIEYRGKKSPSRHELRYTRIPPELVTVPTESGGELSLAEMRDRIWGLLSLKFEEEETYQGVPVRVYAFAMPNKVPKDFRRVSKTSGRLWFETESARLVKMEGRYRGTVTLARAFASGFSYQKGTEWMWALQRLDGHWVPFKSRVKYPRLGDDLVYETECFDFTPLPAKPKPQ